MKNYRPIALISNVSKLIEKLVYIRITSFIEKHNIIGNTQNGFVCGRSVTRATYQLLEEIAYGINGKENTSAIFVDISKAFDCVNHEILLENIEKMGFRGVVREWLKSFLLDRKQCVVLQNSDGKEFRSNWRCVPLGVPQGSILGPLLFLLYINDLPTIINHLMILYADDTSLIIREKNLADVSSVVASNLHIMETWLWNHNLKLNAEKTNILLFNSVEEIQMEFEGKTLISSGSTSFLGLNIDSQLTWRPQIEELVTKLCRYNYALRTIVRGVGAEAALDVYYACVYSRLQYGVIFWGNSSEVERVFLIQKACIRTLFNIKPRDTCRQAFISQNLLTLPSIYILECALFVKKYYNEFFSKYEITHSHETRGVEQSHLPPPKTHLTKLQRSTIYQSIKIYNYLPCKLKTMHFRKFKQLLKKHLAGLALYRVDNFYLYPINLS